MPRSKRSRFGKRSSERRAARLERLARQALSIAREIRSRHKQQEKRARFALSKFRPARKDRGKIVIISGGRHVKGKSQPVGAGKRVREASKRGHAVYVTRKGKVWLLHSKRIKDPYAARPKREIQLPLTRNLSRAIKSYQTQTRLAVRKGPSTAPQADYRRAKRLVAQEQLTGSTAKRVKSFITSGRGRGRATVDTRRTGGLDEKAIKHLAKELRKSLRSQVGGRSFGIRVMVLVQLPDGTKQAIELPNSINIHRQDIDAIRIGGIENFIREQFYALMARQLAIAGYVTQGSANHVRRLAANETLDPNKFVDDRGDRWAGIGKEVVKLLTIEWKIEQL